MHHPDLHSFPTRRSSDLREAGRVGGTRIVLFSVGEGPVRAGSAERALTGSTGDPAAIRAAAEAVQQDIDPPADIHARDRKSTRLNSSHGYISYAVFCLKK